jgi:hypothetical protein
MSGFTGTLLQALKRLPAAVRVSRSIYRFTLLDDEEAPHYLARHPELREEPARALLHDNLDRAIRQGNLPAMRRMHARIALVEGAGLAAMGADEITRRHESAVARAHTDDPAALAHLLAELETLLDDPHFAAAPVEAQVPVVCDTGAMWLIYFELSGHPTALEQARSRLELAAALCESQPVRQGLVLSNLATVESRTFHLTGRVEHLERTVELLRRATATEPHPSVERALHLINLATALMELHSATLRADPLNECIERFREAAPFRGEMQLDSLAAYLRGVGCALITRYRVLGQQADVREGVSALETMLLLPHVLPHDRSIAMAVLGYGLLQQARTQGAPEIVEYAVRVLRDAVELAPDNPLLRLNAVSGLGRAYRTLYDFTREPAALDDAVAWFGDAAALAPEASHWEIRTQSDLGEALTARARARSEAGAGDAADADLRLAIQVLEKAAERARSPEVAGRLALALSTRVGTSGAGWTYGRARAAFLHACRNGTPEVSLPAGAAWGEWALLRGRWAEAEEAFGYALRAADALFHIQAARAHKEGTLRPVRGLAAGAAYAAARAGDPGRAVEILEQGRTRLVAEALQVGARATAGLEREAPALAARLRTAADALASLAALEEGTAVPIEGGAGIVAERVVEARAEFDAVMDEIRRHPGFEVFGAPMTLGQIAEVARPAPLVYLAATEVGGVALIVEGGGGVATVWLPGFSTDAVRARLDGEGGYAQTYRAWREDRAAWATWAGELDRALRWAWDAVVGPVLEALATGGHEAAVVIAPGLLQLLPLHAAWTEDAALPAGRRYAQDVAMLTCAPSARVLAAARPPRATSGAALLLVDNPDGTLEGADRERILRLGGFDPSASRVLAGDEATLPAVLASLSGADVVQFTTHGRADVLAPLRSGVKLAREAWLQAEEILDARLERDPLVVLSACETTLPGTALPEEVVSLPTAFMQAGAGGVIASLWPVDDEDTDDLELVFYRHTGAGASPARALHQARQKLLAADPRPSVWAAFTYTGPLG